MQFTGEAASYAVKLLQLKFSKSSGFEWVIQKQNRRRFWATIYIWTQDHRILATVGIHVLSEYVTNFV